MLFKKIWDGSPQTIFFFFYIMYLYLLENKIKVGKRD